MTHKDRNHVAVPKNLPPWLDGPKVRAEAKRRGVSEKVAREVMRVKRKRRRQRENDIGGWGS